jgi:NAD(P)H-dependent flavin oxidoreductase YrpB (nitropropane dioxygenase family)
LIKDHPRFRHAKIGIVVSSWRALKLFLRAANRVERLPDYIIVEGPLAGGHLGFGCDDWANYNLDSIITEISQNLEKEGLAIPLVAAGGIFDSHDSLAFLKKGVSGVQVATRFAITRESGLPDEAKQAFIRAEEKDVVVSGVSPTGYPFRLLTNSPCLGSNVPTQCISLGFAIDVKGQCQYIDSYHATGLAESGQKLPVHDKICLCHHMLHYHCYTCGSNVVRLKETVKQNTDGTYAIPSTREVLLQYLGL